MNKMDVASRHGLHCIKPIVSWGKPIQASLNPSICTVSNCLAKCGSKWVLLDENYRKIFTTCAAYEDECATNERKNISLDDLQ